MYILNADTSDSYVKYVHESALLIKQWLESNSLYAGGSSKQVNQASALNISREGKDIADVFSDMQSNVLPNSVCTAHNHCLAHLHPPTLLIGQIAEQFIAATNQSMDSWNQSPIATHMETALIAWLCQRCGYSQFDESEQLRDITQPKTSGGVFTSGGTQSNLMGILCARNQFFAQHGVNIQKDGLASYVGPSPKILCSDQAHFSVEKNAALLGLGSTSVIKVSTDAQGIMSTDDLQRKILSIGKENVLAVVATAGTTDAGAIDPLASIAQSCQQQGIWLHVDAAWGGALLLSNSYSHFLDGIAQADSITLDFHKHFFLPISCGAFLLADASGFESIRHHSDYLNPEDDDHDDIPNLVTYSLQTTRRFDALKLWMAITHLGTDTYGNLIDQCIDTAISSATYLLAQNDIELVATPILSSVLFYFNPDAILSTSDLTKLNREISQHLLIENIANISTTTFKNQFCLKLTILNPNVTLTDIKHVIQHIKNTGYELLATRNTPCFNSKQQTA